MKECKKCNTTKPNNEFYKSKCTLDGMMSICRVCHYKCMKDYYNTEEGRNKLRTGQRKYALKLKTLQVRSLKYADPVKVEEINKLWEQRDNTTDPKILSMIDNIIHKMYLQNKTDKAAG